MNFGTRRRSKKSKKKGRKKGSKNKINPEVTRKLGDATLRYAQGHFEEAVRVLYEVIRLSPNLPDPYHRLGLIYKEMGDRQRALNFYTIAAHLTPKDASLWKLLVTWSKELDDQGQARYFLRKAITADPEDVNIRFHYASIYVESGDYLKAAEAFEQISRLSPENAEVLLMATRLYIECGQRERAVSILEYHMKNNSGKANLRVIKSLASLYMEENAFVKAQELLQQAQQIYSSDKEALPDLIVEAGICHVHLGDLEKAEALFSSFCMQNAHENSHLIFDIGDSLISCGYYDTALKYYMILEDYGDKYDGRSHLKIAECYRLLGNLLKSIEHFYAALDKRGNDVDARLSLASVLLEVNRDDEAISVLSPPEEVSCSLDLKAEGAKQWWLNGRVKLKLSQIYKAKGMLQPFVDAIFPAVRETLLFETVQQKFKVRKRLSRRVLSERIKVLGEDRSDSLFQGFRPVASASDLSRASRAKKLLKKKETKKAAALAAGAEWLSDDDSEDESHQLVLQEPPLSNLVKDDERHGLILDLCKGLLSLQRYWEALELINLSLKIGSNGLSVDKKEELRSLGAQIAYNISDPAHAWEYARYVVNQHPYSFAAWNCYYKVISKRDNLHSRNNKFLHNIRARHKDAVPPILISGHQFTMISQHQAAAREYLEAYKLMPESPLINLCVGTALINLALGFRLQNKHQCVVQGLAFFLNNLRLCNNNQEAVYNIARAYHHVGLVSLAALSYEKVLEMHQKDYPIPKLPNENSDPAYSIKPGYCDLRREAAYNLHLIYKKSGAFDLARQVLKDYCSI